jgi:ParB-like chromosome segregation protein Spo0J
MFGRIDQPYQFLPELPAWEYAALKESIRRYGVLMPVIKDEKGRIIDGHHRERACGELGITDYPIITLHGLTEDQKRDHALLLNLVRRKVTRRQLREIIAVELRRTPDTSSNWLAEMLGTTDKTVDAVREHLIRTSEIPKFDAHRGKDGKLRRVTRVVTFKAKDAQRARDALVALGDDAPGRPTELRLVERRARKKEKLEEIEGLLKKPQRDDDIQLYHCPMQKLERLANIQPGSVDLVLTDIPYGRDFLPQLPDLAALADSVLKDGGILCSYCGVAFLDQVIRLLGEKLIYRAVGFSSWSGNGPVLQHLYCVTQATPVVIFSKGAWRIKSRWYNHYRCGHQEQDLHPWQKVLDDMQHWVESFTKPGDVVCDPLAGSFTAAVACEKLARKFIGCDQDKRNVLVGQQRLRERQSRMTGCNAVIDAG